MTTNQQPARVCTCGATFEPTSHRQRYCPACQEAKAAAVLAARVKPCRKCNAVKPTKNNICEDCAQAKRQEEHAAFERRYAKKLARINIHGGCKQCGKPATNPYTALCSECEQVQVQKSVPARSKAQQTEHDSYLADFRQLPEAVQWQHIAVLVSIITAYLESMVPATVPLIAEPEVNPEEVAHQDQDAIDSAFRSLMEGLDL